MDNKHIETAKAAAELTVVCMATQALITSVAEFTVTKLIPNVIEKSKKMNYAGPTSERVINNYNPKTEDQKKEKKAKIEARAKAFVHA